jgi:putative YphP/YqiW family bacilliredoxin
MHQYIKTLKWSEEKMGMYPELMVIPMREELTKLGIEEAKTAADVDKAVTGTSGAVMVIVNSICGCAAGKMRPAVRMALQQSATRPERSVTVFAGQDTEATQRARELFAGQLPSSPSIGILRDGKLVYFMPRQAIETRDAMAISAELQNAFKQHCGTSNPVAN